MKNELKMKQSQKIYALTCSQGSKVKGILLYKKLRALHSKEFEIELEYLLTHPDNVISRLQKQISPSKGAGKVLIEKLQEKAMR